MRLVVTVDARWIEAGEPVQVAGRTISSGLFYLGETVVLDRTHRTDQFAVNPKLKVGSTASDVEGQTMPYWPSYATIGPEARRAFIEWMASGRKDPSYDIGYVFLFFYGLEHRLFLDQVASAGRVLIPEVERLLSIYGQNNSFRHYGSEFLTHARIAAGLPLAKPRLSPDRSGSLEVAPETRVYLGEKLAVSSALSADDVLLWMLALPETYLRTPAVRCFDEFVALWRVRFAEKYKSGFQVSAPSKKISFTYRAASGAFQVEISGRHEELPDIAAIRQSSLNGPQKLLQACTDTLDGYSRFVGRNPLKKTSVQAVLLLPDELQGDGSLGGLKEFGRRIGALMGEKSTATLKLDEVLKAADLEVKSSRVPPICCEQLGRALDRIDVAIEPDRRYGGGVPQLDDQVVIFRAPKGGPIDAAKPAYQKVKFQVEVGALAAAADGHSTLDELQTIIANIRSSTDLDRFERLRLIGYAITIFKDPPKQARIMRRLAECSDSDRQAIAAAASSVIAKRREQADPQEVRFLERLHKSLGLPREDAYGALHRASRAVDEPVAVSPEDRVPGIPIPREPVSGIRIDAAKLEKVQRQTQAVSQILTQIFAEYGDDLSPATAQPLNGSVSAFEGLDKGHAELVEYLEIRGEIPRQEFEQRAKALKLLPEGAIETINDWSFDRFDEPLLEDGEHIVLAPDLRDRLSEARAGDS